MGQWSGFGTGLAQGAIEGTANGLLNSVLGQLGGSLNARRSWKYYKKQMELNYQYYLKQAENDARIAREQYDYELDQESPEAQRTRLENAGLNAGLMYSNAGGAGVQASVNSVNARPDSAQIGNFTPPNMVNMHIREAKLIDAQIEKEKAQANMFNAEAEDKRGETDESRARINDLIATKNLKDSEVQVNDALSGYYNAQEVLTKTTNDIQSLQKDALDQFYDITKVGDDGKPVKVKVKGNLIGTLVQVAHFENTVLNNHKQVIENANYDKFMKAQIANYFAEATCNKSLTDLYDSDVDIKVLERNTLRFLESIRNELIEKYDGAEDHENVFVREAKREIDASIEKMRRYMNKEFDGSSTEWFSSWMGCLPFCGGATVKMSWSKQQK